MNVLYLNVLYLKQYLRRASGRVSELTGPPRLSSEEMSDETPEMRKQQSSGERRGCRDRAPRDRSTVRTYHVTNIRIMRGSVSKFPFPAPCLCGAAYVRTRCLIRVHPT